METSNFLLQNFVFIASEKSSDSKYVGDINQLNEIIQIHKLDEVIFCAKDLSSYRIIETMESLSSFDTEFKIAPPESLFILGSSSIDFPGDLYLIGINSLNKPKNLRSKRLFDIFTSVALFITSPILILIVKRPANMLKNIAKVFKGKCTWVGYSESFKRKNDLPHLKSGILSPLDRFSDSNIKEETKNRINIQYAKDYNLFSDFSILVKGLKKIDQ